MLNRGAVAGVACSFLVTYYRGFVREHGAAVALADLYGETACLTYAEYNEETPAVAQGRQEIVHQLAQTDVRLGRRKVVVSFADYIPLHNGGLQVTCQGILHLRGQRRAFFQVFVLAPTEYRTNTYHIVSDYFREMMIELESIPEDSIVMSPADVAKHLLAEQERCKRQAELLEQQRAEAEALQQRERKQREQEAEAARRKVQRQQQQREQREHRRERGDNGKRDSHDDTADYKSVPYDGRSNPRHRRGERHDEPNEVGRRERREQRYNGRRKDNRYVDPVEAHVGNESVTPSAPAPSATAAPRQREPRQAPTDAAVVERQSGNNRSSDNVNRPLPRSLAAQQARVGEEEDKTNDTSAYTNRKKGGPKWKEMTAEVKAPTTTAATAAPTTTATVVLTTEASQPLMKITKANAKRRATVATETPSTETTFNQKNAVHSRPTAKRVGSTKHVRVLRVPTAVKLSDIKEVARELIKEEPLDAYWFGRCSEDCVLEFSSTTSLQNLMSNGMKLLDENLMVVHFNP